MPHQHTAHLRARASWWWFWLLFCNDCWLVLKNCFFKNSNKQSLRIQFFEFYFIGHQLNFKYSILQQQFAADGTHEQRRARRPPCWLAGTSHRQPRRRQQSNTLLNKLGGNGGTTYDRRKPNRYRRKKTGPVA